MTDRKNGWNNGLTLGFCWGSSKAFVIRHFGFVFPMTLAADLKFLNFVDPFEALKL